MGRGLGKSTVGRLLAFNLAYDFYDGDDLHTRGNPDKVHRGIPLDEDRRPWLAAVRALTDRYVSVNGCVVIVCSAFKQAHRTVLIAGVRAIRLIFLKGSIDLIAQRLVARQGHFFDPALLRNQFDMIKEPRAPIVVDVARKPAEIVTTIRARLAI